MPGVYPETFRPVAGGSHGAILRWKKLSVDESECREGSAGGAVARAVSCGSGRSTPETGDPDLEHGAWSPASRLEACAGHLRPLLDAEPPAGEPPGKGTVTCTHPDGTAETMVTRIRRALARFGRAYLESCAYLCPDYIGAEDGRSRRK